MISPLVPEAATIGQGMIGFVRGGRGGAIGESKSSSGEAGAALRNLATDSNGGAIIAIVRQSGNTEQPTTVSLWGAAAPGRSTVAHDREGKNNFEYLQNGARLSIAPMRNVVKLPYRV
jgi:hypothetical protein